ncbi:hypothetical protein OG589_22655 [Sphaerisporangium sp. NBC_01403]|uniref:hypothetical protein n=1 Tax=Sphaerisporangium sp. NBC_01403 TaxID=2903599 RepID=UPI00324BB2D4
MQLEWRLSLLERITERRARLTEHLAKELADVQHELDEVSVAEQVVARLLAEDRDGDHVGWTAGSTREPVAATVVAGLSAASRKIPDRHDADGIGDLPDAYRTLVEAVTAHGGPATCKQVCERIGQSTESAQVEGQAQTADRPPLAADHRERVVRAVAVIGAGTRAAGPIPAVFPAVFPAVTRRTVRPGERCPRRGYRGV